MSRQLECYRWRACWTTSPQRYPDNEALVYLERGLRYTYREFNEVCRQVAKGLLKLGVKKGDNVSIWAYNVPEWVILQFATAKIGAVLVTVNTSYKSAELEYILNQSDSTTLFMVKSFKDTDYVETLYEVVPELATAAPGELAERQAAVPEKCGLYRRRDPGRNAQFQTDHRAGTGGHRCRAGCGGSRPLTATTSSTCSTPPAPPASPRG